MAYSQPSDECVVEHDHNAVDDYMERSGYYERHERLAEPMRSLVNAMCPPPVRVTCAVCSGRGWVPMGKSRWPVGCAACARMGYVVSEAEAA